MTYARQIATQIGAGVVRFQNEQRAQREGRPARSNGGAR
jgi:hypothetical protein